MPWPNQNIFVNVISAVIGTKTLLYQNKYILVRLILLCCWLKLCHTFFQSYGTIPHLSQDFSFFKEDFIRFFCAKWTHQKLKWRWTCIVKVTVKVVVRVTIKLFIYIVYLDNLDPWHPTTKKNSIFLMQNSCLLVVNNFFYQENFSTRSTVPGKKWKCPR